MNDKKPVYNVVKREPGEPADTGELLNTEPLSLYDAVTHALHDGQDLEIESGFIWDGTLEDLPPGVRHRQQLHHEVNLARVVYIDVVEVEEATS